MAAVITIPSVGESVSEVTIGKWLKREGEAVDKDEVVLALETDKVNVEVTAPEAGVLRGVKHKEGDTAKIGEEVARIEAGEGKTAAKSLAPAKAAAPAGKVTPQGNKPTAATPAQSRAEATLPAPPAPTASSAGKSGFAQGVPMPAAARALHDANLLPTDVTGSGPGGRILKEDVQAAGHPAAPPRAPTPAPASTPADTDALTETVPMSGLRKKVAERLVMAQQTAAILTTFNEVDMSAVLALRKQLQDSFVARHGIKLGFMSFFVKAAIDALRAFPEINASIEGTDIVYRRFYDIGVAVSTDKGLVVPVVRRAELLSFGEIEQAISGFGQRAKANKLTMGEMTGGTFTITNGGVFGSLMSTPILNPPQSGILGMHSIVERPVGVNGQIVLRPMMYTALSYDHRIVDGRGAVSFLKRIKECVEAPERMLLEV